MKDNRNIEEDDIEEMNVGKGEKVNEVENNKIGG